MSPRPSRWLIAGMGTLLQLCLGSVYAWSYFQKPLTEGYGWSNAQVAWTFSLAIGFLGLAAAAGGVACPASVRVSSPSPEACSSAPGTCSPRSRFTSIRSRCSGSATE